LATSLACDGKGFTADPGLCFGESVLEEDSTRDGEVIGATVGFGEEAGTAFVVTFASALERVGFAMESAGVKATAQE
jgi:hypothetical protein